MIIQHFSYNQQIYNPKISMTHRDYITLQKLGEGSFGVVQKVMCMSDNTQYAMKTVKYMEMKQKNKKSALNEIRILSSIDHPNIIKFKEAFFQEDNRFLCSILELAPNGDLADRIKQKINQNQQFQESQIWKIGLDILYGIKALHDKNIIHRDIKPANIFFSPNNDAKLGDFNVSVTLQENFIQTQTGTPYYASPQVWNYEPYAFDCDIWSFGCLIYEMCALKKPFQARNIERLYQKIKKLRFSPIPIKYSYSLQILIDKCLSYQADRIDLQSLIHSFETHNTQKQEKLILRPDFNSINFQQELKQNFNSSKPFIPPYSCHQNPEENIYQSQKQIGQNINFLKRPIIPESRFQSRRRYTRVTSSHQNIPLYDNQLSCIQSPFQIKETIQFRSPPRSMANIEAPIPGIIERRNRYRVNIYY